MESKRDFRSKFYQAYFSHQASRSGSGDIEGKIRLDHKKYEDEFAKFLPKNRNLPIFELACGYGSFLLFLQNKSHSCSGIDVSEEQIDKAVEMGVDARVEDIVSWTKQGSADQDLVFAIDLIEHFDKEDLLEVLTGIRSRMKENATLIVRTPNMDAIRPTEYAFGDFTHGALLNSSSATQLFLAAGFNEVAVKPSSVRIGGVKEGFRKVLWMVYVLRVKLQLFASGRSTKGVILTPNLIIVARK